MYFSRSPRKVKRNTQNDTRNRRTRSKEWYVRRFFTVSMEYSFSHLVDGDIFLFPDPPKYFDVSGSACNAPKLIKRMINEQKNVFTFIRDTELRPTRA